MSIQKQPIRVAVTGAAGQIAYSLLFRIASGAMFGPDQPIKLHLIDLPQAEKFLHGTTLELEDCNFPLLEEIIPTCSLEEGFRGVHWALLVGSMPRKKGMERSDLLGMNGKIFVEQGKAIQDHASFDVQTLVVGNPCNTNCWVARHHAPDIPDNRWFAMMRLDQNRARMQLAKKSGVPITEITHLAVWGNHSPTMYPGFQNARVQERLATDVIQDRKWLEEDFLKKIQQRGAEVIGYRGASSAASAANAIVDTVHFISNPIQKESMTSLHSMQQNDWFSVAIPSDGSYGIEKGLIFSFPIVKNSNGELNIVQNIRLNDFSRAKIQASMDELLKERETVIKMLDIKLK